VSKIDVNGIALAYDETGAGAVVVHLADAVDGRVAHVDVRRRHVNFCAQGFRAVREFPRPHPREQVEVFLHGTVAIRAFLARDRGRAAILDH